jgi:hypothetical protein
MGLLTNKETDPGLTQAQKEKKFQDALLSVYSQEQLDAIKILRGFGVDTSYITPENIQPDTGWMGDVSPEDVRSPGVDNIINQSKAGQSNLLKQQEMLDNAESVEDIKNSVLETENTWDFGLGETSKKGFVPAIIAAEKNNIPLVEHVGDDRYRIVDIGVEDKDLGDYAKALESQGLLPENPQGWEAHRTKDGTISISTDQPSNPIVKDIFKSVVLSGITQGIGGAFGGAGAAAAAEGYNPFNLGMLRDVGEDLRNKEEEDDPVGASERPMIGDTPVGDRPGWHWERDPNNPDNPGGWKAVPDDPKDSESSSSSSTSTSEGGSSPSERGEKVDVSVPGKPGAGDNDDRWVWNGDVLVNTTTGATREVTNSGRMEEGEIYNGDGDPVGENKDDDPGLGKFDWNDILSGIVFDGLDSTIDGDTTDGTGSTGDTTGDGTGDSTGDTTSEEPSPSGDDSPGDDLVLGPGDRPSGEPDDEGDDDTPGDGGDGNDPEGKAAEAARNLRASMTEPEWEDFMHRIVANYQMVTMTNKLPSRRYLEELFRSIQ